MRAGRHSDPDDAYITTLPMKDTAGSCYSFWRVKRTLSQGLRRAPPWSAVLPSDECWLLLSPMLTEVRT